MRAGPGAEALLRRMEQIGRHCTAHMNGTDSKPVVFVYVNHRGEKRSRSAFMMRLWLGSTKWHPEEQWFVRSYDTECNATRDFAVLDIEMPPAESRK